jgi:hypothetical protein
LGGPLWQCDPCGQEHNVDHSGHTPSCPKCHHLGTTAWLAERRPELLPVPYLHLVFTVSHELGELIRRHQQGLYGILRRAAAQGLMQLAADPHDIGGLIEVRCVLPTWTRTLAYFRYRELARMLFFTFGYPIHHNTVEQLWHQSPITAPQSAI